MSELMVRWIVFYRRYSSDGWTEAVKHSEHEAQEFVRNYLYGCGFEAQAHAKKFVEVKGKSK